MKIRCMARGKNDKGIIQKEDCLQCALSAGINVPCGFDYTLLKYIYSQDRYMSQSVHVSDLLSCPRRAFFSKRFIQPTQAYNKLIVTYGTLQHTMLEAMEDEHYSAEIMLDALGIVGTSDVYYKSGSIVDYKTIRNMNMRYLPRVSHIEQVNIYAQMLRESNKPVKDAAIQYIDFVGPSKCPVCKAFVVPNHPHPKCPICNKTSRTYHLGAKLLPVKLWSEEKVKSVILDRRSSLQIYLDNDVVPPPTPEFLCRYCPYLTWCNEGSAIIT